MRSNYKKLGNYIRLINELNDDGKVKDLLGVSNNKYFQKSHTNTIGIDLKTYRITRTGQFAYNRATTRNGDKISIALRQGGDCIVSPSYRVFQIINENELLSEYLLMWFKRPEFDRYVRFKSHGSAHEFFEWEEMCEVELPVPSIEKQREIVKEYNVIQDRIKLNNQLIQKLEDTAQAIYKQWFVDFEFPDENGKPYKSNGGEMAWCEEIGKDVPIGWRVEKIGDYVKLSQGLVINATTHHLIKESGIPLLRITDLINDTKEIFIDQSVSEKNIAKKEDIIITRTGQVGLVFRNKEGVIYNNCFKISPANNLIEKDYLFWFLKKSSTYNLMVELASDSSAQFDLTHTAFNTIIIILPMIDVQKFFSKIIKPFENNIEIITFEIKKLEEIKKLLLSKLATIES